MLMFTWVMITFTLVMPLPSASLFQQLGELLRGEGEHRTLAVGAVAQVHLAVTAGHLHAGAVRVGLLALTPVAF